MSVDLDNPGDCAQWARLLEAATKERNALRHEVACLSADLEQSKARHMICQESLATALAERDEAREAMQQLHAVHTRDIAMLCADKYAAEQEITRLTAELRARPPRPAASVADLTLYKAENPADVEKERDFYRQESVLLTAERDALGGEVERLKADLGAAQATADDRFKWRHVVERETAEAIAAFVDTEAEARREEGFSYRAVSELAADIRSGSWKEPK